MEEANRQLDEGLSRAARGVVMALAGMILAYSQSYAPLPIWPIGASFVLMSMVSGLHRYGYSAFTVLIFMVILPPPLIAALGAWITALVK